MPDEPYRILGQLSDSDAAGILGRNTAASGTAVGVEGAVDSPDGFGLYTDDDAFVGGALEAGSLGARDVVVDYTGSSSGDHGLEVIDRSTTLSEQISVKGDPDGSSEILLQDVDESNYKWGLRASADDNLYLDDHASLTTRIQVVKDGALELLNSRVVVGDGDLDLSSNAVRRAGTVRYEPRDVRTISNPDRGWTAYHDGSGSNTEGPAFYDGAEWTSQVDGTTIG